MKSERAATFQYDAKETLLDEEHHHREFDARGNWAKDTVRSRNLKTGDLELVQVTYREIVYY
ncbi:MAG TPA: hypothetical protein VG148_13270 [Pyrinomonadaceae bacterium]|nr:hypothetical protein [Pyrinomonadaceae bacterium]